MATRFLFDDFESPDGVLLEQHSPGWVRSTSSNDNGPVAITGGRAAQQTATRSVYCRADAPAPSPDYEVSAPLYFVSGQFSPSVGICGRMAGPGDAPVTFYQARLVNNGSGVVLARFLNGTTVTLASVGMSWAVRAEPLLTLRMDGSQLSVLVDGQLIIGPISDTYIVGAGYVGMRFASAETYQVRVSEIGAAVLGADDIDATLNATLDAATLSSTAQLQVSGSLSSVLGPAILESAASLASTASLTKTLAPAVLTAIASIEAEPPQQDGVEGALSKILDGARLGATASVAIRCGLSSTLAGLALAATARTATALDISKVHSSRIVMFGGSGSRVVIFEGSGSRLVVFEGSGTRIRINEMDVKVPIRDGAKWKVDRDRDEISYYAADITNELWDRNTTAVQSEVVALPYGVEVLEEAQIQISTIEGIERTFVVVKLGGVEGELPDDWRWVARVPCANGERFDKTTWFNEVDP